MTNRPFPKLGDGLPAQTAQRMPFEMGYTAALHGESGMYCPFEKMTKEHREWHRGHAMACEIYEAHSPTIPIYRTSEISNGPAVGREFPNEEPAP